jgi:NhaP-type Na+/H+ or K+/H+ antiporter
MDTFRPDAFVMTLALIGVVILIAAWLSGLVERSGLPQVAIFLALGASLGPAGLGLLDITLNSPILRVVATLSLVLVLFTDAVTLSLTTVRRHSTLALLILGPGTLLTAALIAGAAWWLLDFSPPAAIILGAALASTDPVLLRGLLRRPDIPGTAQQALRLESGLNDVVLLPVVLVAMVFLATGEASPTNHGTAVDGTGHGQASWVKMGIDLFLLGPGAGVAVGLLAVATLDMVRRRSGVRRDYESLYSLGVAFSAYAAAEAMHGSGFLAAFAAGLTMAALDVELCDCFLEYGETTAEMALLFTFVLFGSSLIWSGFSGLSITTLLFAAIVLLVRPISFYLALARYRLDQRSRQLIAWFGPRGLSSLLLILLPVFAGLPESERLFSLCCLVVVVSVVLHGGYPVLLAKASNSQGNIAAALPSPSAGFTTLSHSDGGAMQPELAHEHAPEFAPLEKGSRERISLAELERLLNSGQPVTVLDVRSERTYGDSELQARGAIRLSPDHAAKRAEELGLPRRGWSVTYCT